MAGQQDLSSDTARSCRQPADHKPNARCRTRPTRHTSGTAGSGKRIRKTWPTPCRGAAWRQDALPALRKGACGRRRRRRSGRRGEEQWEQGTKGGTVRTAPATSTSRVRSEATRTPS